MNKKDPLLVPVPGEAATSAISSAAVERIKRREEAARKEREQQNEWGCELDVQKLKPILQHEFDLRVAKLQPLETTFKFEFKRGTHGIISSSKYALMNRMEDISVSMSKALMQVEGIQDFTFRISGDHIEFTRLPQPEERFPGEALFSCCLS